jgi:vacuolar-type H+-ATPase subunit B/Vma2
MVALSNLQKQNPNKNTARHIYIEFSVVLSEVQGRKHYQRRTSTYVSGRYQRAGRLDAEPITVILSRLSALFLPS